LIYRIFTRTAFELGPSVLASFPPRFPHAVRSNSLSGLATVLLGSNVVAVKDAPRLVAKDLHGHALGRTRADVMARRRPSEVVNEPTRETRRLTRCAPGIVKITHGLPFVMKDVAHDDAPLVLDARGFFAPRFKHGEGVGR